MIYKRRSVRKYRQDRIPQGDILKMIEAAKVAPSAKNRQPWKFIIYSGNDKEALLNIMERGIEREFKYPKLPESASGIEDAKNTLRIMREAPITVCVIDPDGFSPFEALEADQRFKEINSTLSIGAAVENLILKATELGYGTLWIGNTCFAYQELMEELKVNGQLVCAIAVGIPAESPEARPRKPLDEIVEFRGDWENV